MVVVGFAGWALLDPRFGPTPSRILARRVVVDELAVLGADIVRGQRLMERGEAVVTGNEERDERRYDAEPRRSPGVR